MLNLAIARFRNRWIRKRLRVKELPPLAYANLQALDHLSLKQRVKNLRFVVLDLETTGLSLTRDHIVSMAAYRVVEGRILLGDTFNSLVNPDRTIPSSAVRIHGIVPSNDISTDSGEIGKDRTGAIAKSSLDMNCFH